MTSSTEIGSAPLTVRVLVVEDSPSDALLAVSVLQDAAVHRFLPTVVPTIREALPLLEGTDVVLLDLNLPDACGVEGLDQIRRVRHDVPVIVLTGEEGGPTTEAALAGGAQDYLVKDDLTSVALDRAIAYARARQSLIVRVEASERWARALVHSVSDIVSIHDAAGELVHLGGQGASALAWSDPPRMADLRPHLDTPTWLGLLRAFRRWQRIGFGSFELSVRLPDGTVRHLESVATDMLDDPTIRGIVVTTRDVTDRRHIANRLAHEATHDALTGLPNRTLFHDRLRGALARQRRDRGSVALLMVDIDNFKHINDSYGHPAGDEVLRAVASLLTVGLRDDDTLARLSGDEFAIVCPNATPQGAARVAHRLQRALVRPFIADGHEVYLTASVGIALSDPQAPAGATDLLRNADLALYQSKSAGRSCVSVFDERLEQRALRRMEIETELRGALTRQELAVVYQPVVDLETGRVGAHEALLRWTHPRLGEIAPDEFVPIAEDCGLIVPLGRWVLERACVHLAEWRRASPGADVRVAVNVSARQLVEPGFVAELLDVLQRTDVPASALALEVTETALIAELADSSEVLRRLRSLGVRVALDDFGTGYSSLTYLKRLPVDVLKIDKSFIDDVGQSAHDQAVVGGVAQMARALGLEVVAEGVEDEDQRDQLRLLGCNQAQGYLFSRPIPSEAVLADLHAVYDVGAGATPAPGGTAIGDQPARAADPSSAVADLVHELMQPLTVIRSYSESFRLLAQSDDVVDMATVADAISRNSAAAITIVQSLTDAGQLEQGALRLDPHVVTLSSAVGDLVDDLRRTTDVPIELELVADAPVALDVDRFRQILTNLVTNAVKFAPTGTPIVVRVDTADHDEAVVSVIDSGPGVPADVRAHLFEKYRKHGNRRGSGVGLYIARQLARLHGGDLQYRRAHTGGAELVLTLPCASGDDASLQASSGQERTATAAAGVLDGLSDDPAGVEALHAWTRELLRARTPERVVSISIGLVRSLGGTVVPADFADPAAIPLDLSMGHGPPLLPSAAPLTVARLRLERLLPLFAEDARDTMQACRGFADNREIDPETGVLARWPLARRLESVGEGRDVLVVQAPAQPDGRRTLARLLRSVTDPADVIGVWDDLLVVVRDRDSDRSALLVDDIDDQWSRWGGAGSLDLALVHTDGAVHGERALHVGVQQLSAQR